MKKVLPFVKYGAIAFAVIGLIMTAFRYVGYEDLGLNGLEVVFGYKEMFSFSFWAFIAIVLPLIGSLSILFKNRLIRLIGSYLMLTGIILCFRIASLIVFDKMLGSVAFFGLGAGAILTIIFYTLGFACNVYSIIEKK